jgi:hypothetical protein
MISLMIRFTLYIPSGRLCISARKRKQKTVEPETGSYLVHPSNEKGHPKAMTREIQEQRDPERRIAPKKTLTETPWSSFDLPRLKIR